jgi:hypothetical protein
MCALMLARRGFFLNEGNKHCPDRLIKKKVSDFLGENRAKTDTNGAKPRQHSTTHAQGTPHQPDYQHKPHTREVHACP